MSHFLQSIFHLFVPPAVAHITVEASVDNAVYDLQQAALDNERVSKLLRDTLNVSAQH